MQRNKWRVVSLVYSCPLQRFCPPARTDCCRPLTRPFRLHGRCDIQVYKARLRVNGNLVAIKVQRPNCESTISLDLYVLRFYAGFLTKALKALKRDVDLTAIIDDFGELIYREIDYRAEMVNCQRFAELYANIPDVFVPKVHTVF